MNNEQILVKFLNCGFLDLKVLEDTKFDVMEIISEIERPTLNDIICAIFQKGIDLLLNALMEKQRDFDCPDEIKYLSGEDIDFDINFVASRIYFFNLTCKKSPPSIGGEMNCGFFCGFDALRKTIAL